MFWSVGNKSCTGAAFPASMQPFGLVNQVKSACRPEMLMAISRSSNPADSLLSQCAALHDVLLSLFITPLRYIMETISHLSHHVFLSQRICDKDTVWGLFLIYHIIEILLVSQRYCTSYSKPCTLSIIISVHNMRYALIM